MKYEADWLFQTKMLDGELYVVDDCWRYWNPRHRRGFMLAHDQHISVESYGEMGSDASQARELHEHWITCAEEAWENLVGAEA